MLRKGLCFWFPWSRKENLTRSKVSLVLFYFNQKRPGLNFPKVSSATSEKIDRAVVFTDLLTAWITVSINCSGQDIWEKSLLNNQYTCAVCTIFFSNSISLEQQGFIIETLEYPGI